MGVQAVSVEKSGTETVFPLKRRAETAHWTRVDLFCSYKISVNVFFCDRNPELRYALLAVFSWNSP
jgi:hypothetical protein